ncbi:MAG: DegV family protein [Anaerolineales bacterium]|jgi:DegV family protein with EDD domain
MSQVCILTDSTAQFPTPAFAGRKLVNVIPLHVHLNDTLYHKSEGIKAAAFPPSAQRVAGVKVLPPSLDEFQDIYTHLGQFYEEIVVILHTSNLTKTYQNALEAAALVKGKMKIIVIDALTTATGLGLVVQAAAAAAKEGIGGPEIDDMIRSLLPRMYSVFCIQGLSYLHRSGYLSEAQAIVGEFLDILPIFILESGRLIPTLKARNNRHLVDLLHEFLSEFTYLDHIALLQGVPPFETETRALRERLLLDFENTPISEHTISPELAGIIGPHSLGMFALQSE